jgi:S-adenosylmethionine:tRNA ribosyltransferase-isomerase
MRAAARRGDPRATRLLHVDPRGGSFEDLTIDGLPTLLESGDLVVLNDAATIPASLRGVTAGGLAVEVRLAGEGTGGLWRAVLFGDGDWHTRTEERPAPPALVAGDEIRFEGLRATVERVDDPPRLVALRFDARGDALWRALYRAGRPVQYAYTAAPFALWDVQTAYASRPWAVEPPSAGFALTWELLLAIRRKGVGVARVTHAAGLSSTGDPALDRRLPFPERFEVPEATVAAIEATRARAGRVVAIGTTVARALAAAVASGGGRLVACSGVTDVLLGPGRPLGVVDAIVTGVHEAETSHYVLLETFAPRDLLDLAHAHADSRGYRGHEFGDAVLVLNSQG